MELGVVPEHADAQQVEQRLEADSRSVSSSNVSAVRTMRTSPSIWPFVVRNVAYAPQPGSIFADVLRDLAVEALGRRLAGERELAALGAVQRARRRSRQARSASGLRDTTSIAGGPESCGSFGHGREASPLARRCVRPWTHGLDRCAAGAVGGSVRGGRMAAAA